MQRKIAVVDVIIRYTLHNGGLGFLLRESSGIHEAKEE
jgi:hypothetical protein